MIDEVSGKDELLEQPAHSPEGEAGGADAAQETPAQSPSADTGDDSAVESSAVESEVAETEAAAAETPGPDDSNDHSTADVAAAGDDSADENDDDDDGTPDEYVGHAEPIELVQELVAEEELDQQWFILKVASNRENSIADALRRRVKVEGLDAYFGQIIVPVEEVAEFKNGKKRIAKKKLYPGYICVQMHVNDDTWFAVRDTPGIGDFTGAAGKPTPMLDHEVERILPKKVDPDAPDKVKSVIKFKAEDRVRIKEGTFENFEGDVESIDEANGRVTVVINIFDRPTPVEIDHWQLESV